MGVAEAEPRSGCTGVLCVEEAIVGYEDFGLTLASLDGGASGGAAAGATAVLILMRCMDTEQQSSPEDAVLKKCLSHTDAAQMKRKRRQTALDKRGCRLNGGQAVSNSAGMVNVFFCRGRNNDRAALLFTGSAALTRRSQGGGRVWQMSQQDSGCNCWRCSDLGLHRGVIGRMFDGEVKEVSNARNT